MVKTEKKENTGLRFRVDDEMFDEVQAFFQDSRYSASEAGRVALDYFMHLPQDSQDMLVGLHKIWTALRIHPGAISEFQKSGTLQVLSTDGLSVKTKGMMKQSG